MTGSATGDLLEHLSTAVVLLARGGKIGYLNPAAESLLQVSRRRVRGRSLHEAIPGLAPLADAMDRAGPRDAGYTEREYRLPVASERFVTVDCTVTPLPDGRVVLELSALDRQLRISRDHQLMVQNRAIRDLVRGLAHEIRNPLGGLRGAAQLLEAELTDAELRQYTEVIIGEADRLRALVDGLLEPERQPRFQPVSIHEILERVRHLARTEAAPEVEIRRDYDPSIPALPAAADHLIQALLNLVRNALQAVGPRGRITLRTRICHRFTIGETQHRLVARIDVIDDGPGVAEDLRDRLFYPMVTGRPGGIGIGLPIAQTLVAGHGGLVEYTREPGQTVFSVWLPLERIDE